MYNIHNKNSNWLLKDIKVLIQELKKSKYNIQENLNIQGINIFVKYFWKIDSW